MLSHQPQLKSISCCRCHPKSSTSSRQGVDIVASGLSLGFWIFLPKCPACLTAHVAFWTGLGLSFTQAAFIRWSVICLCPVLLCYLTMKYAMELKRARRS